MLSLTFPRFDPEQASLSKRRITENRRMEPIPCPVLTSAAIGLRRSSRVSGWRGGAPRRLLFRLLRRGISTAALVSVDREQRKERPEETSHRNVPSWNQPVSASERVPERL